MTKVADTEVTWVRASVTIGLSRNGLLLGNGCNVTRLIMQVYVSVALLKNKQEAKH